jgi:hypothetical protein
MQDESETSSTAEETEAAAVPKQQQKPAAAAKPAQKGGKQQQQQAPAAKGAKAGKGKKAAAAGEEWARSCVCAQHASYRVGLRRVCGAVCPSDMHSVLPSSRHPAQVPHPSNCHTRVLLLAGGSPHWLARLTYCLTDSLNASLTDLTD